MRIKYPLNLLSDGFALLQLRLDNHIGTRYLALAVEPVSRPEREGGHRHATSGRTLSDTEARLMAKSPIPTNPLRSNLKPLLNDWPPASLLHLLDFERVSHANWNSSLVNTGEQGDS